MDALEKVTRRVWGLQTVRLVVRLGVLQLVLGGYVLVVSAVFGLAGPAGPVALWAWLGALALALVAAGLVLRAFWAQRRWAWWVLVIGEVVGLVATGRDGSPWSLLVGLLLLGLLLHPDSREWVRPESRPIGEPPGTSAGAAGPGRT